MAGDAFRQWALGQEFLKITRKHLASALEPGDVWIRTTPVFMALAGLRVHGGSRRVETASQIPQVKHYRGGEAAALRRIAWRCRLSDTLLVRGDCLDYDRDL